MKIHAVPDRVDPHEWRRFVIAVESERLAGPRPVTTEEFNQVLLASRGDRFDEEHYRRVVSAKHKEREKPQ